MHSMKGCKKSQSLKNLILHLVVASTCSLLCCYHWFFSDLSSSTIKHFFLIPLPCIWSSFFSNPNCLFVVVNVIVIFLLGESKLVGTKSSSPSSPVAEIYNEYVERSRSCRRSISTPEEKEVNRAEEKEVVQKEEEGEAKVVLEGNFELVGEEDDNGGKEREGSRRKDDNDDDKDEEKARDGEEEGLPSTEELNRRVEEFIARVNKQRWLEAKLLVCSGMHS